MKMNSGFTNRQEGGSRHTPGIVRPFHKQRKTQAFFWIQVEAYHLYEFTQTPSKVYVVCKGRKHEYRNKVQETLSTDATAFPIKIAEVEKLC